MTKRIDKKLIVLFILVFCSIVLFGALIFRLFNSRQNEKPDEVPIDSDLLVDFNDENAISGEALSIVLPSRGQVIIEVSGTDSYSVEIQSNISSVGAGSVLDVCYYINGGLYVFDDEDYTDEFLVQAYDDYFVVECFPGYYDLQSVLCRKWNVSSVRIEGTIDEAYYYKMIISSAEGKEITVLFNQE